MSNRYPTKTNLLANVAKKELSEIKVAIIRHSIAEKASEPSLIRGLDDPHKLEIHIKIDRYQIPIFNHPDVIPNVHRAEGEPILDLNDEPSEKSKPTSSPHKKNDYSRSRPYSPSPERRHHRNEKSRYVSPPSHSSFRPEASSSRQRIIERRSRSPPASSSSRRKRSRSRSGGYRSKSRDRSRSPRHRHHRDDDDDYYDSRRRRRRSISPSNPRYSSSSRTRSKYRRSKSRERSSHKEPGPVADPAALGYYYYPGDDYWMPPAIPGPRHPAPMYRFHPPPGPRPPPPPGAMMMPRYHPVMIPPPYHLHSGYGPVPNPRLPVYNSRPMPRAEISYGASGDDRGSASQQDSATTGQGVSTTSARQEQQHQNNQVETSGENESTIKSNSNNDED